MFGAESAFTPTHPPVFGGLQATTPGVNCTAWQITPSPTISDIAIEYSGCYPLVEHDRHTEGELSLIVGEGVICHAVQFTPGVVA